MTRMRTWARVVALVAPLALCGSAWAKQEPRTSKGDTAKGSTPAMQASQGTSTGVVDKKAPKSHSQGGSYSGSDGPFENTGTYGDQRNVPSENSGTSGSPAAGVNATEKPGE
jgi:hypothetical protein